MRGRDIKVWSGMNHVDLAQGMAKKRWCTPKPQLQPLKEMVRNESSGSRVNPGKGNQGLGGSEAQGGLGHLDVQVQWAVVHRSSPPAGQTEALRGSPWPSLQPWGAAWKPGYGAGGAYSGVESQPGNGVCGRTLRGRRGVALGSWVLGPGPPHSPMEMEGTLMVEEV